MHAGKNAKLYLATDEPDPATMTINGTNSTSFTAKLNSTLTCKAPSNPASFIAWGVPMGDPVWSDTVVLAIVGQNLMYICRANNTRFGVAWFIISVNVSQTLASMGIYFITVIIVFLSVNTFDFTF